MEMINPNLDDFHAAWRWLCEHPAFFHAGRYADDNLAGFAANLDIEVVKVNPATDCIDDDPALNTTTAVWLECGGYTDDDAAGANFAGGAPCHDTDLDCGAATFEEAIIELAKLVHGKYGDYPRYRHCTSCLKNRPAGDADPDTFFCSASCEQAGTHALLV